MNQLNVIAWVCILCGLGAGCGEGDVLEGKAPKAPVIVDRVPDGVQLTEVTVTFDDVIAKSTLRDDGGIATIVRSLDDKTTLGELSIAADRKSGLWRANGSSRPVDAAALAVVGEKPLQQAASLARDLHKTNGRAETPYCLCYAYRTYCYPILQCWREDRTYIRVVVTPEGSYEEEVTERVTTCAYVDHCETVCRYWVCDA